MDWETLGQFEARSLALACTLVHVSTRADIPHAVAGYLASIGAQERLKGWSEFTDLPWRDAGLRFDVTPVTGDDEVGLTGCHAAVAETGALMLLSGATTPMATSLVPPTHIAVVRHDQVVRTLEGAWRTLRQLHATPPRSVNFIAGPSRTGDVEQTTTIGVHGPRRVHLILIDKDPLA
jgi:L-lactate dehydrogenase complex protein LldG